MAQDHTRSFELLEDEDSRTDFVLVDESSELERSIRRYDRETALEPHPRPSV